MGVCVGVVVGDGVGVCVGVIVGGTPSKSYVTGGSLTVWIVKASTLPSKVFQPLPALNKIAPYKIPGWTPMFGKQPTILASVQGDAWVAAHESGPLLKQLLFGRLPPVAHQPFAFTSRVSQLCQVPTSTD